MASKAKLTCKCIKHEEISGNEDFKVYKHTAKKLKKATYEKMLKLNLINRVECAICTSCVRHVECEDTVQDTKKVKTSDAHVENVVKKIKDGDLDQEDTEQIINAIASNEKSTMQNNIDNYKQLYKDDDFLSNMTMDLILGKCNSSLIFFILCLCNVEQGLDAQRKGILIKIIELIYLLFSGSIVAPFHFVENLLVYFLTGSKTICNMLNKYSPSGSYSTIVQWLENRAIDNITVPKGDFICFFDNNQILSRNWRVKYNSKYSVNVITSVIYIIPDQYSVIQQSVNLSPFYWLSFNSSFNDILQRENTTYNNIFNQYRNKFLNSVIEMVDGSLNELSEDHIDTTNNHTFNLKCIDEKFTYGGHGVEFVRKNINFDPYDIVSEGYINKPSIHVGEPEMLNPCSYNAVESLLENISQDCQHKEWYILGCDGSPYLLAARMIEKYCVCPLCTETLKSEESFLTHISSNHKEELNISFNANRKFKNILLIPGLGHFEINLTKAIFKLLWIVCLEDMAKMLGFKSTKALTHCQAATNHHQSWQMLQILLHGTAAELVLPFVKHCRNNNIAKNSTQYYIYLKSVQDPCYKFMSIAIFSYVLAVHLFRCGMRKNNHEVKSASRWKASPLYYGLNMTSYQEIEVRDRNMRVQCPPEVRSYLDQHECMSVSGHTNQAESGDFILEAQNRRIKRWMPPGVPNEDRWRRVCRNIDRLDKLKERMALDLEEKEEDDNGQYCRSIDISEEIFHWRKLLRQKKYLSQPMTTRVHSSTSGALLDPDLINFSETCRNNQLLYNENGKTKKLCRIFVTPSDRDSYNDIKNKTKKEIEEIILEKIRNLDDEGLIEESESLQSEWDANIRKCTKAVMLSFYKKVCETSNEVKT